MILEGKKKNKNKKISNIKINNFKTIAKFWNGVFAKDSEDKSNKIMKNRYLYFICIN